VGSIILLQQQSHASSSSSWTSSARYPERAARENADVHWCDETGAAADE
jgi:hypothetical protein